MLENLRLGKVSGREWHQQRAAGALNVSLRNAPGVTRSSRFRVLLQDGALCSTTSARSLLVSVKGA
jgi:hypothetical protein